VSPSRTASARADRRELLGRQRRLEQQHIDQRRAAAEQQQQRRRHRPQRHQPPEDAQPQRAEELPRQDRLLPALHQDAVGLGLERGRDLGHRGEALLARLAEQVPHQRLQRLRDLELRQALAQRRRRLLDVRPQHLAERLLLEGEAAGEHLVQQPTQRAPVTHQIRSGSGEAAGNPRRAGSLRALDRAGAADAGERRGHSAAGLALEAAGLLDDDQEVLAARWLDDLGLADDRASAGTSSLRGGARCSAPAYGNALASSAALGLPIPVARS
jgi:hypothetical protein